MNKKSKDGFKIINASPQFVNTYETYANQQEVPSHALSALKRSIYGKPCKRRRLFPKDATLILWKKPQSSSHNTEYNRKEEKDSPTFRISGDSSFHCQTAWDVFHNQTKTSLNKHITCCNREIDDLLGSGVELGKITEFCGVSGSGKTQIGMQLACDVQLPRILNGVGGQCIYIDTSNGVIAHRLHSIARSFIRHIHAMAHKRAKDMTLDRLEKHVKEELNSEKDMLSNILIYKCFDYHEFDNVLMTALDKILSGSDKTYSSKFHNVKLIVIDSISRLIKHRENITQYVLKCGQLFHYLCKKYGVAIVCMNQMTTRMKGNMDQKGMDSKPVIVPSLGFVWTSIVNVRVQLFGIDEIQYAKLIKTCKNIKTNQCGKFKISGGGIRTVKSGKKRGH
eukprot:636323_1